VSSPLCFRNMNAVGVYIYIYMSNPIIVSSSVQDIYYSRHNYMFRPLKLISSGFSWALIMLLRKCISVTFEGWRRESECVGVRYRIVKKWCLNWIALVKYYVIDTSLCFSTDKLECNFIICCMIILLYIMYCYIVCVLYVSICKVWVITMLYIVYQYLSGVQLFFLICIGNNWD
jgi:hypothetical protein